MPLIYLKDTSVVDMMDLTGCPLPKCSEVLSPRSSATMGFENQEDFSAPLSPNHVQEGHSQDMPAEGSVFDVSPDLPGYNMRPAEVGLKSSEITQPPPSVHDGFNDLFFGAPIAFAQCNKMPGLDTPMTLPIYNMLKEANIFPRSVGGADSIGLGSITRQYTMVNRGGYDKGHFEGRTLRCECFPNGYGRWSL